jgi:anaphase-promoting complex subunit 1
MADICDYLTPAHEPTTVAVLLGVSATKLASGDPLMSRTLCLHLPSLLAPANWDFEISPVVQAAALAGLGLVHCGTSNRLMTEFLLAELSRQPSRDSGDTREACSLVAGWSLGMVLVGKGRGGSEDLKGLSDLKLEDRLHQYISGGYNSTLTDSLLFPSASTPSSNRGTRVLESRELNTDVTAPGAIIALALMYIQSSNPAVANKLAVPISAYELDSIRPDLLLFRAMGWSLVMWDNVEAGIAASDSWIDNKIPDIVNDVLFKNVNSNTTFDAKAAYPVYFCIVCGYCFGIGLIFAGTANLCAKNLLLSKLRLLQSIRDQQHKTLSAAQYKSYRGTIEMCISVTSLSLSCVMAGTGDLDCMRLLRQLRWKYEDGVFGFHMSLGMALGQLFLAGGQASLKRDPMSIGALLISFCPRFPMRTVDNQYHLQALRHMHVLAVEWRSLVAVDIHSRSSVAVQVTLRRDLSAGLSNETLMTPCLLPELSTLRGLEISNSLDYCDYTCFLESASIVSAKGTFSHCSQASMSISSMLYVKTRSEVLSGGKERLTFNSLCETEDEGGLIAQAFTLGCHRASRRNSALNAILDVSCREQSNYQEHVGYQRLRSLSLLIERSPIESSLRSALKQFLLGVYITGPPETKAALAYLFLRYGVTLVYGQLADNEDEVDMLIGGSSSSPSSESAVGGRLALTM